MKKVQEIDVNGKVVLVRFDYNVPIKDGVILDDNKIKSSLETLKYLINNNAKVVILSHLGKVKNEGDKVKNSLEVVCNRLKELMNHEVYFSKEIFSSGKLFKSSLLYSTLTTILFLEEGDNKSFIWTGLPVT